MIILGVLQVNARGMSRSPQSDTEMASSRDLGGHGISRTSERAKLLRRRSAFIPPGFVHTKFATVKDEASGVTFQAGYEGVSSFQPPKVLHYDPSKLVFSLASWRALRTMAYNATATRNLAPRIGVFSLLAVTFGLMAPFAGPKSEEALSSLNNVLSNGVFFILGPYVATAVTRWWQVRRDGVGGLWGAIDDLASWSASWFCERTIADRAARALVIRLGLLSHALLYKEARGEAEDLEDLLSAGILLEHEARALQPLASKPLVVWAWMTHFWTRALASRLDTSPIPHAAQLAPMIHTKCMQGRGAIGLALAYVDTQQPFTYLHLLSTITDVALALNSAAVGVQAGRYLTAAPERLLQAEVPLHLLCAFVRVASFVLISSGLLSIGVQMDNPMGDDPGDFPALAHQVYIKRECESFGKGIDAINLHAGWWEGLGEPTSGAAGGTREAAKAAST